MYYYFINFVPVIPTIPLPHEELVIVLEGLNVTLDCLAEGIPAPTITWKQNNTKITGSSNLR
jgi:hypothetical protein